jgi:transcriptional regulator with XRE-family HTH domain
MTLYDKRKQKLLNDLKNKEYRDAFIAEHIYTGIPFQIKALRKQKERNWTQAELGKRAGMFQTRIRVLEDPDNESLSLNTLLRLASAFNVGLMVRFVPLSELVKWDLNLSSESLEAQGFDKDRYFKESNKETATIADSDNYKEMSTQEALNNVVDIKDYSMSDFVQQQRTDVTEEFVVSNYIN